MKKNISIPVLVLLLAPLAACATKADRKTAELSAWADSLVKARRVNENWSAACITDQVTMSKKCFASTFGRRMGGDGEPYGSKSIAFQIYFLDERGPFIMVGFNTYPGRTPTVRIDENEPIQIRNSPPVASPSLVEQLRLGRVARGRYHVWPTGSEDIYVDLTGFEEAWRRLNQLQRQ